MININNFPMLRGDITLTNNVEKKFIDNINLPLLGVRKTRPRSNTIKQIQKQNTEYTQYKRDTDLRGSPSVGYVHQRNCQVLSLLLSSKMKGYNL
jgi:hypothetical protein